MLTLRAVARKFLSYEVGDSIKNSFGVTYGIQMAFCFKGIETGFIYDVMSCLQGMRINCLARQG